jgi:large subunit ribosomal protein LP1
MSAAATSAPTTTTTTNAEKAVSYAALILADESITITPEKLQALLKSAKIEHVEPIWTTLFAKALEGRDVKDVLTTVGTATVEKVDKPNDDEERNEVELVDCGNREEIEFSDDDMGLGLFD